MLSFGNIFEKNIDLTQFTLEANGLKPRSGPTYVGPDLGFSLFAIAQKYR